MVYLYLTGFWQAGGGANGRWGFQPQQILETTATQTQEKETATQYTTVIPPALALIYLPPSTTCCAPTGPHPFNRLPLAPPPACQNPVRYKYTTHPIHLPMKMELIEGSETSAIRTQTPGNYPKENILQHWNCKPRDPVGNTADVPWLKYHYCTSLMLAL